jgi:SAM-dependent methyltransferase
MSDAETIAWYDARARDYADRFAAAKQDRHLAAFRARLPENARVLDLGCGPGHAAAQLAAEGHETEAWDAAKGMVALAARHPGVTARQARFGDLQAEARYHGIWANFSLLHAPRADFPGHIAAIARALRPGGVFHLGMKTGADAARDHLGRSYTFYTSAELEAALAAAGLAVVSRTTGAETGFAGTEDPFVILLAEKPHA